MASDADSAEELYNKADVALYTAKHSGRNSFTGLQAGTEPGIREELDAIYKSEWCFVIWSWHCIQPRQVLRRNRHISP
jgi:hypothetical protein